MIVTTLKATSVPVGASSLLLSASVKAYIWMKVAEGSDCALAEVENVGLTCTGSHGKAVDIIDSEYDTAEGHDELTGYTKVAVTLVPGTAFYIYSAIGIVLYSPDIATTVNGEDLFIRQQVLAALAAYGTQIITSGDLIGMIKEIRDEVVTNGTIISLDPASKFYIVTYLSKIRDSVVAGTYTLTYRDVTIFSMVVKATTGALKLGYTLVRDILILMGLVEAKATLDDIHEAVKRLTIHNSNWNYRV